MSDTATPDEIEKPTKGRKAAVIGLFAAVVMAAAAFYVTYSGIFFGGGKDSTGAAGSNSAGSTSGHGEAIEGVATSGESGVIFVQLDPLVISLGKFASSRHLRFQAYLEVEAGSASEVAHSVPRVLDVLNTYLRAISESELENPASMNRLRAQMLRRVQVVVGEENVRDLLITEFVLN